MIDRILAIAATTDFDFRPFAYPYDELSYLFDDWVDYYRLKYAIATAIQPAAILEVGVRDGCSAIAFLTAAPEAKYVGLDTGLINIAPGVERWLKEITRPYGARFLRLDTRTIAELPGDGYQLINVHSGSDGDRTFHEVELALAKGRFVLVEGNFSSHEGLLATTYCMNKYRQFIEYALVIPGQVRQMLIKTRSDIAAAMHARRERQYQRLANCYDKTYFLTDCEGYESFRELGGRGLNHRLAVVSCLVDAKAAQSILDIGCGRGELAYAMSRAGATVTGIDYSADAIAIAQETYRAEAARGEVRYIHGDFLDADVGSGFERVVASDVVEHLEPAVLDRVFARVARLLVNDGRVIVHTAPNLLHYGYSYPRRRKLARAAGTYLPPNPRTFYEDLMHINEQTPARLRRALRQHFAHVLIWTANFPDAAGCLGRHPAKGELGGHLSIFAVASQAKLEVESTRALLRQERLDPTQLAIELTPIQADKRFRVGERHRVPVRLRNCSGVRLTALPPYPVSLCYHWRHSDGSLVVYDGVRTPLTVPLMPGETRECAVAIDAPGEPGRYHLESRSCRNGVSGSRIRCLVCLRG